MNHISYHVQSTDRIIDMTIYDLYLPILGYKCKRKPQSMTPVSRGVPGNRCVLRSNGPRPRCGTTAVLFLQFSMRQVRKGQFSTQDSA